MMFHGRCETQESVMGFRLSWNGWQNGIVLLCLLVGALALGFFLLRVPSRSVHASEHSVVVKLTLPSLVYPGHVKAKPPNLQILVRQAFVELGFDLHQVPAAFIDRVNEHLRDFTETYHKQTQRIIDRSAPYRNVINKVLRQYRLPDLFAVVPFVESAFDIDALHPKSGARGLWQFMAPTARSYGLKVSAAIDQRLDPYWSTLAASRYLNELQNIFGRRSPLLVLAAYNFGESNLSRAIVRARTRDIWKLFRLRQIPTQTRYYLVKTIAIWCALKYADHFQFVQQPADLSNTIQYVEIAFPSPTTLSAVAKRTAMDETTLRSINPHLLTDNLPAYTSVRLPIDQAETLSYEVHFSRSGSRKKCCSKMIVNDACRHTVRAGETLSTIAYQYPISIAALKRLNRLEGSDPIIRPGQELSMCGTPMAAAKPVQRLW
ncbi:MAG: transglycosylase SLT domain-containing protein [bacterium]|nr:transglycosylase SLT domain-containing protein [bacterium]